MGKTQPWVAENGRRGYNGRMTAILLLLAAARAFGSGFDYESAQFWMKGYALQDAYCSTRLVAVPRDYLAVKERTSPCQWENESRGAVAGYSRCRLDAGERDKMLERLGASLTIIHTSSRCAAAPDYPELGYKRDQLNRESALIAASSSVYSGVWGLLEAQSVTLNSLIGALERARRPSVEFILVTSSSPAIVDTALKEADAFLAAVIRRENPAEPHWTHHWARVSYPACEQVPVTFVTFAAAPGSKRDKSIRSAIRRLGTPYEEAGCRFCGSLMFLDDEPSARLARKLADLDGFVSFRRSMRMRYFEDLTDDERFDILTEELERGSAIFERAPHIRAFVRGELERVRPTATRLRGLKRHRLIVAEVKPPESLSR